jgi:hypothetical protein
MGLNLDDRRMNVLLKEDRHMSLQRFKVCPGDEVTFVNMVTMVAVSDMSVAADFFEGKLGLGDAEVLPDGSRVYACGGGSSLHIYAAPDVTEGSSTTATWYVTDLEQVVDELISNGVVCERHEESAIKSNEKGIVATGDGKIAWFMAPDGHVFAIEQ